MNPARTFDFIQRNPEASTVIEQFKNGDYDGLLNTKGSLQLLAQALGQDVDVLTTSIKSFLGLKGAFDYQTNTVVLDVTQDNRSGIVDTFGHEIAHGQGIKNETSADLIGKNDRNTYQQKVSGRDDRVSTDHGGHLIASMFKGPGEGINIVPMDKTFNGSSGAWYELETTWKKALESNKAVKVNIQPVYSGTSKRPASFIVEQNVGGKQLPALKLKNTATGK